MFDPTWCALARLMGMHALGSSVHEWPRFLSTISREAYGWSD